MFIDRDEIEEMLGCYYDFSQMTDEMWNEADELIEGEWERRGYTADDTQEFYDTYSAVCDGAVGRVLRQHGVSA